MSHMRVIVFVPADTTNIKAAIAEQLVKYDENTHVEPYTVDADMSLIEYCTTSRTEKNPNWALFSSEPQFISIPIDPPRTTEEVIAYLNEDEPEKYFLRDDGTVGRWTTYNPDSKWDYWVIGGRYSGVWGEGIDTGDDNNILPVTELPHGWSAWAVVTKDGAWHDKGDMGWFGCSSNDKDPNDWNAERYEIASGHANCLAVIVDCHI